MADGYRLIYNQKPTEKCFVWSAVACHPFGRSAAKSKRSAVTASMVLSFSTKHDVAGTLRGAGRVKRLRSGRIRSLTVAVLMGVAVLIGQSARDGFLCMLCLRIEQREKRAILHTPQQLRRRMFPALNGF
jgi:hypothetical protein